MRQVLVLLGIVIIFSLASRTTMACSCMAPGSPCESYGAAAAVFVGAVTDARPMAYKFSVEQAYVGVAGSEIEVFTGSGGGDCGFLFQKGERYLVYAYRYNDMLTTSICTRTKLLIKATDDLAFLGTLSSAAPGVTISGTVTYNPDDRASSEVKNPLSPEVLITIESESGKKEIRPDLQGAFRITGLPPGKYKATLRLPENLTTYENEKELTLSDRGCGVVRWIVNDNGRINGRVVTTDGVPVADILVSLMNPDDDIKEYPSHSERTDEDGKFSFSAVPRGAYQIAINQAYYLEPKHPTSAYQPSFYPGVLDRRNAKTIDVRAGEKLSDIEIRIPPKRLASTLIGSVVWADGTPVAKARIDVEDQTYAGNGGYHSFTADEQGRFQFEGYAGQKLVIKVESNSDYVPGNTGPTERSEPLKIKLENTKHTVRIVITKLR